MKKIKEITGFGSLDIYKGVIIVYNKKEHIYQIDEKVDILPLLEENIYSVKVLDDDLLYKIENPENMMIYEKNIELKDSSKCVLHTALKCDIYIYIYSKKYNSEIFLDANLQFVREAPEYCNFSYKQYLFHNSNKSKLLICYELNNELWKFPYTDDSNIEIIAGYQDKVLLYSESGDLFALNLENGEVCWKYPEQNPNGRYCFFENYIYHLYKNVLREINAETGVLNRVGDVQDLREKEHFLATGGIKAYNDYIFLKDVDGAIAIIDRETMKLKEILRFEHHLGNFYFPVHWLNNKLYVQDVKNVIHIFEGSE